MEVGAVSAFQIFIPPFLSLLHDLYMMPADAVFLNLQVTILLPADQEGMNEALLDPLRWPLFHLNQNGGHGF